MADLANLLTGILSGIPRDLHRLTLTVTLARALKVREYLPINCGSGTDTRTRGPAAAPLWHPLLWRRPDGLPTSLPIT